MDRSMRGTIAVSILLLVAVFVVYGQVGHHEFINLDDPDYVYANPQVKGGLSLAGLAWAFTTFSSANWHPLAWLSHMLDVQLFGLNPAGHHLMSVALHAANTLLLFLLFRRLTGMAWRSAVVAALFALHPLHVESVAWVAERKDLLSTFFGLLGIYLYAGYVAGGNLRRYVSVLLCFVLSLMAKPMLVTMPFLLLLLDYWPLGRCVAVRGAPRDKTKPPLRHLLLEKIPFILLAAASCLVTLYAQHRGEATSSLTESPLPERVANALVSYSKYLGKLFWPQDLALLYPFPDTLPLWQPLTAGAFLVTVTLLAIMERKRSPYLFVGWFWYLGTLVPVIGFVRVGSQAMADRYTYLPSVGIFLIVVWVGAGIAARSARVRVVAGAATVVVLLVCSVATWRQVSLWKDNVTLYTHTLAVTRDNSLIHNNLGFALDNEGDVARALYHYGEAVRIDPRFVKAYLNMASCLSRQGKADAAIDLLRKAVEIIPDAATLRSSLGVYLLLEKRPEEAIRHFEEALKIDPEQAEPYFNLGVAYGNQGKAEQAIGSYRKCLAVDARHVGCHYNLGVELFKLGRREEASLHFSEVLRLHPEQEMESMARSFLERISENR
jgi:Tfp pilus assembly protein PilF